MDARKRRSHRSGRAPLRSPGRSPVAGRSELQQFWLGIAQGVTSENAALAAGMSQPVGTRLFRKAGGMPPAMFRSSVKPLSGRYLSFAEREEIALLRAQGHSMQEIGRRLGRYASTISRELRRNAATRSGGLEYRASTRSTSRSVGRRLGAARRVSRETSWRTVRGAPVEALDQSLDDTTGYGSDWNAAGVALGRAGRRDLDPHGIEGRGRTGESGRAVGHRSTMFAEGVEGACDPKGPDRQAGPRSTARRS